MESEKKNKIIQIIDFISSEVAKPKDQRRVTLAEIILSQLADLITVVQGLAPLWAQISPVLLNAFK